MMNNFKNMGLSEGAKAPASPSPFPLARQQSVYSLTFDEFQNTLGGPVKDFGSMNMDEFLRNIWTAEETHAMASALGSTANSNAPCGLAGTSSLQRQGSLTLPRTLSQKTVDEVWKDLMKESAGGQGSGGAELPPQQQRQPTLGEITLEEFLVRAGVVREDNTNPQQVPQVQQVPRPMVGGGISTTANPSNMNGGNSIYFGDLPGSNNNTRGLALGFAQNGARNNAMGVATMRPYPPPLQVRGNVDVAGNGDTGMNNGLMSMGGGFTVAASMGSPDGGLGKGNGDLSSLSPVPYQVFGSGMRGRKCSGAVEKVVERRQRRMIKNRESAARSRARKQAYTMELEAEVAKLKEQNEALEKKQAEMMEMQKNQVMEIISQQRVPKKLCLRRTQTGPW